MPQICHAIEVENAMWDFCPSQAASYSMLVCFALATCTHAGQTLAYRKPYCWTIVVSGFLQTLAYLLRVLSIRNPSSLGLYAGWFVLILIAPLWINAFVYMVLGRMVWNFTSNGRILGVSSWRLGQLFVVLDIVAAIIQIYGAGTASDQTSGQDVILKGLHIYMAGIGLQLCFICVFFLFALRFQAELRHSTINIQYTNIIVLLSILYISVFLISARIIFRLVEYSSGLNSAIPRHEVYQYCLDSMLMLIASTLFNIVHPGRIMPGKNGDLPTRKQRKKIATAPEALRFPNSPNQSNGGI